MNSRIDVWLTASYALATVACGSGVELLETQFPKTTAVERQLGLADIPYIRDDTFIVNPSALLGQVIELRRVQGQDSCPEDITELSAVFSSMPVLGIAVDEASILATPQKRESLLVNQRMASSVNFLGYLAAELDAESAFSLIVFDQASGRVDDSVEAWPQALNDWRTRNASVMADERVCYLVVVKGYVQKNVVRRKFQKVEGEASGGAYGVKAAGNYLSSSEDYSIDVRFGLSTAVLKRPDNGAVPRSNEQQFLKPLRSVEHTKTSFELPPPETESATEDEILEEPSPDDAEDTRAKP